MFNFRLDRLMSVISSQVELMSTAKYLRKWKMGNSEKSKSTKTTNVRSFCWPSLNSDLMFLDVI